VNYNDINLGWNKNLRYPYPRSRATSCEAELGCTQDTVQCTTSHVKRNISMNNKNNSSWANV